MSKQPHVIITVGKIGTVMTKAAPDNYSIEAYGYTADEVRELFATVHDLVRPTDDTDTDDQPIPFKIPGGFTIDWKLNDANAEVLHNIFGMGDPGNHASDGTRSPRARDAVHDGKPGETERCGCATDDPAYGRIRVTVGDTDHRFVSVRRAMDFGRRHGVAPEEAFVTNLQDDDLCCFPYALFMPGSSGIRTGFQSMESAEQVAALHGLGREDITYFADEHQPRHLDTYKQNIATIAERTEAAPPAGAYEPWVDVKDDDDESIVNYNPAAPGEDVEGPMQPAAEPGCEGHETTQGAIGDVFYCDGTCRPQRKIPAQRADEPTDD